MDLQTTLKSTLNNKYQTLNEAYAKKSLLPPRPCYRQLNDYQRSSLHEHEFRYVDKSDLTLWDSFGTDTLGDILSCDCKHDGSKKTVITLGVCGVGKTTAVHTFALVWAGGNAYSNIQLLFPLTFWELNLLRSELSLIGLLKTFYPELKELDFSCLNENNVWFVLDGLDEYHHPLNFSCPTVSDASEVSTVDNIVTSLIRGDLLPCAHVWITTRFSAATQIPVCHLLKQTMIQGFNEEQKAQRFRTVIGNEDLANKALNHVKISRSLDFLCQIPPICAIMVNVLKDHLKPDTGFKINPLNLTQIYTNLIKVSNPDIVAKLKKMALRRMGNAPVMYESDFLESDLSVEEASTFTKECPLVLREETGLHNTRVFRFGHSSVEEFLAASAKLDNFETGRACSEHCQYLVVQYLKNPKGKTDAFLRFIFGLVKERDMLKPCDPLFLCTKKLILRKIVSYSAVPLLHCLREYDQQALRGEVKFFLMCGLSPYQEFSPRHWNYMVQRTSSFEGMRESFEIMLSTRCDDSLLQQLPAILKSKKAMLRFSNLTDKCCPALAGILSTALSYLRELDLGYNSISDNGVKELVKGLNDPNCRLKTIRLPGCGMTSHACEYLATAVRKSLKLIELDLSMNEIGDDGMKHLSDGLGSPECKIETLRLSQCNIEQKGCYYLASALQKNSSSLKVLDLSINMVGDKGAIELFKKCDMSQLIKLEMYHCGLTVLSCRNIGDALNSGNGLLVELNLSNNNLKDEGFQLICQGMFAWCRLEKLNVSRCGITGHGCFFLSSVLGSVSQLYIGAMKTSDLQAVELKELDLSMNCLGDDGVKELSCALKNPFSNLKILNLSHCSLTYDCCPALASGLSSMLSIITELDLSGNNLQDKGLKKLCVGLRSPRCKLEKLSLRSCGLSFKSIPFLTAALKSNPQHLAELHLMGNNLEDSGIRVLLGLTENQKYCLHTIDVSED
ncbi:NACHT, LRR and PYD domains-containing protein 12-like [Clinocottus analis]|uniref:NACHT, LRR and PYD domains-containing protein 12-like n=1 Tax=Clinocottus analis TaxID=304258 RepID=UPI0035BEE30F